VIYTGGDTKVMPSPFLGRVPLCTRVLRVAVQVVQNSSAAPSKRSDVEKLVRHSLRRAPLHSATARCDSDRCIQLARGCAAVVHSCHLWGRRACARCSQVLSDWGYFQSTQVVLR